MTEGTSIDAQVLRRITAVSLSSICDADKSLVPVDSSISLIAGNGRIAGPARTVFAPDDHLPVLRALAEVQAGDVLVIATGGGRRAVLGELFAAEAARRGVAGIIIDGYCRDVDGLRTAGITIYARGTTPASGTTVNFDNVSAAREVGGVAVTDGDLVIADCDGVLLAEPTRVLDALEAAEAIEAAEARILSAVQGGEPLHDQLTYVEHVERLRAGQASSLAFVEPRGRDAAA